MNRLMRSRTDRKIAGICGGRAQQNDWDPTVVRLVWLALLIFGGTGILAYIVMWVVVPEEPLFLPPQATYAPVYPGSQPYPASTAQVDPNAAARGPFAGA